MSVLFRSTIEGGKVSLFCNLKLKKMICIEYTYIFIYAYWHTYIYGKYIYKYILICVIHMYSILLRLLYTPQYYQ